MRSDLTDVTMVIDRSGSMSSCREEAENGVNHFIQKQREAPGECLFTLVQFDSEYEFVHRAVKIGDVPKFTLQPRGMTALLDAVGRAVNEAGVRLAAMQEDERPGLVVFVIATDGEENASHEFKLHQIREMIERQQRDYNWKFTFLGANQDAFAAGASLGVAASGIGQYATKNSRAAFDASSASLLRMRSCSAAGLSAVASYTEAERKAMA